MALSCDLRFISKDAFMGLPEVQAGYSPGGGGTQRLARLIGISKALEICLTGRRIYPDEAERLGLVVRAVDPNELMPQVMRYAHDLALLAPVGLKSVKEAIYEGSKMTFNDGLRLERKLNIEAICSAEAMELMDRYLETGQDLDKATEVMGRQNRTSKG
jgi:enoyl-CoA hydratase/carnithine racemase